MVQVTSVADPPIVPGNVYVEPAQIAAAAPALTVAAWLMVSVIVLVTAGQGPAGSLVEIVRATDPAVMSAAEGVYVAVVEEVLLNVPLPLVVQVTEVAPPPMEPARV